MQYNYDVSIFNIFIKHALLAFYGKRHVGTKIMSAAVPEGFKILNTSIAVLQLVRYESYLIRKHKIMFSGFSYPPYGRISRV